MKKILIFGANGAIGRYLVDYFYERRNEYQITLATADLECCSFIESRSDFYRIDISKKNDFEKLPRDIYAVINLATVMPARMVGFTPQDYISTNIGGTFNLLEFCRNNKVDRFIFAQTATNIHYHNEYLNETYLKVGMPRITDYKSNKSIYLTSMNTCEELLKCYHALYGLKAFVVRLPTVYYWFYKQYCENGNKTKEGFRILLEQAIAGEDIYVWGDPYKIKDMLYIKDLCQIFYKTSFVNRDYGYYNAGTGIGTSLLDQIKGIVDVFCGEKKSKILFAPEKRNAPQYVMDIVETINELGYKPCYNYIEMLKDMKLEMNLNRFGN